ncbi:hypothetical protein [Bradyrhizobium viridifuturi]|uniref:hypothetical protein n=1 Tax=Bradyrhizobium viridifuturi TaxID=1654716 RepID=UPI000A776B4C
MRSSMKFGHQEQQQREAAIFSKIFRAAVFGITALAAQAGPASALNIGSSASLPILKQQASGDVVQVRAVVHRGGVAVGPRGGAVAYRSRTVVRPGVRPGWHGGGTRWVGPRPIPGPRPGGWVRPGWYGWPVAARSRPVLRSAS